MSSYSIESFKSLISQERGLARSNLFLITLPSLKNVDKLSQLTRSGSIERIAGYETSSINILCKGTSLPGRQIMTVERNIGMTQTAVAHGYAVAPVSMTFSLPNTYFIRKYFEDWQELAVSNKPPYQLGYFNDYVRDIKIAQMRKGEDFAVYEKKIGKDLKLPSIVKDMLPSIGPIDLSDIAEGNLKLSVSNETQVVYEVTLEKAFPTSMSEITLSNELEGICEFTVEFSYKNWTSELPHRKKTIADKVTDVISFFAAF